MGKQPENKEKLLACNGPLEYLTVMSSCDTSHMAKSNPRQGDYVRYNRFVCAV